MKISVAVRQKFHGFNLAQELFNHNVLGKLYTSYYGKLFGKDNSKGFSINPRHICTNLPSALLTYALKKNTFEVDDFFGKWVASKMGEEDMIITWGIPMKKVCTDF